MFSRGFSDAAAKWWLRFVLLTYDDSSFPCHLSQCSLISRRLARRQFQLRAASEASETRKGEPTARTLAFPCVRDFSLSLRSSSLLKQIEIKLSIGSTTFNALFHARQFSFSFVRWNGAVFLHARLCRPLIRLLRVAEKLVTA